MIFLAADITQVIDSIPWVLCASGNVLLFCRKIGVTVCAFFGVKFLAVNGVLVNYMRYALIYCRSFFLFCFSVETHQFLSAEYSNSEKYFAYIRFQREISNPSKSQKCCCCAASVQNPILKQKKPDLRKNLWKICLNKVLPMPISRIWFEVNYWRGGQAAVKLECFCLNCSPIIVNVVSDNNCK